MNPSFSRAMDAFDSLRAEEESWLDDCYVEYPDFDLLTGARSYMIVGEEGAGKTALFRRIRDWLDPSPAGEDAPSHLVAYWCPRPQETALAAGGSATAHLENVLAKCADAILGRLAQWPARFEMADSDVQYTLAWFTCRYLGDRVQDRITAHSRQASEAGRQLLDSLLVRYEPDEWLDHAKPNYIISELIKSLRELGVKAIYILVDPDDLGELDDPDDFEQVVGELKAFFSALTFFQKPEFRYKLVFPEALGNALSWTGAVDRRRIDLHVLHWTSEDLTTIVLERIQYVTGEEQIGLADICEDATLVQWLERTGGKCPRGWLKYIGPLVREYLKERRPITTQEWKEIRAKAPPPLRIDESDVVTVGYRRVESLTDVPMALLSYLYKNRKHTCTRQELYHGAYLPYSYPDTPPEDSREYRIEYDHILDSSISRLRKEIEPDLKSPLYVITVRGKGYRLQNAW